jgi:hypothetical protein
MDFNKVNNLLFSRLILIRELAIGMPYFSKM